jgi:membrane protein DedA with SNARE-associated domain
MALLVLIAHAGHDHPGNIEALAPILVAAIVVPLIVLAVVARVFWRAAQRDREPGGSK